MIIGITGFARSGKNEMASRLVREHGFHEDSFAGPLRRFLMDILGVSLDELDRIKETPHPVLGGKTPRFAMQTIGTEWGRETISNSLWVDSCFERIAQSKNVNAVISDVRFENEAIAIIQHGGIIVRVDRPGVRIGESNHASEQGIDNKYISNVILNGSSLDEYYAKIDTFINERVK